MLNLNLPVSSEIISPYEWYYQNTIVKPLWTGNDIIVFKATLPLVAVDAWRHLQFQVWPIPLGENYIRLNLPTSLLHDTRHSTIMLEPNCLGCDPLVCVASSVGSATQYPCVNSLLQHEPKYDDKCYITVSRTPYLANNVLKIGTSKNRAWRTSISSFRLGVRYWFQWMYFIHSRNGAYFTVLRSIISDSGTFR